MYRVSVARVALMLASAAVVLTAPLTAQTTQHHSRRENATRQARIARNIEQTYSHKWDFFGGGGYMRFRSGEYLQRNNEVTWAVSATRNFNPKWGVIGEVQGHYGNAKVGNPDYVNGVYNPLISEYTFMAGPQYRFYRAEKTSAAGFVTAGAAMGNFDGGTKAFPAYMLGMWNTSTAAAFSAGVNLDYNFYPNLAFRFTPYYLGTTFHGNQINPVTLGKGASTGSIQNNLGFNVGVVYRWGHQ